MTSAGFTVCLAFTCVLLAPFAFWYRRWKRRRDGLDPARARPAWREEDPWRSELAAALRAGDFASLETALSSASPPERDFGLGGLAEAGIPVGAFDDWVTARPMSALALAARASRRVVWAWEARGGGFGKDVGDDAAERFVERLELAESDCVAAAEADPALSFAWAERIVCAQGLNDDVPTCLSLLARARTCQPEDVRAHLRCANAISWRWLGGRSHEAQLAFAREASENATPGSPLHLLVVRAHFDVWETARVFQRDESIGEAHLDDPAVQAEIRQAISRSILAPDYRGGPWTASLENRAAWLAFHQGDDVEARAALLALEGRIDDCVWGAREYDRTVATLR